MYISKLEFVEAFIFSKQWSSFSSEKEKYTFISKLTNKQFIFLLEFRSNLLHDYHQIASIFDNFFETDIKSTQLQFIQDNINSIIIDILKNFDFDKFSKLYDIFIGKKATLSYGSYDSTAIYTLADSIAIKDDALIPFIKRQNASIKNITLEKFFPVEYIGSIPNNLINEFLVFDNIDIETLSITPIKSEVKSPKNDDKKTTCNLLSKYISDITKRFQEMTVKENELNNAKAKAYNKFIKENHTRELLAQQINFNKTFNKIYYHDNKDYVFHTEKNWDLFQSRLKNLMELEDLTQTTLASIANITEKTLRKYLNDPFSTSKTITKENLSKLSCALFVTIDYLIGKTDLPYKKLDRNEKELITPFIQKIPYQSSLNKSPKSEKPECRKTLEYIIANSSKLLPEDFDTVRDLVKELSSKKTRLTDIPTSSIKKHKKDK